MIFDTSTQDGIIWLAIQGDMIGGASSEEVIASVDKEIQNDNLSCVIDIQEVKYLNSSGIGVLITIMTKFRNRGGEVVLLNPSKHVKKLLIITKLQNIFNIATSKNEALQFLTK